MPNITDTTLTIPSGASVSNAYQPKSAAVMMVPSAIVSPASLQGITHLTLQVSHDNAIWYNVYNGTAEIYLTPTISALTLVTDVLQQAIYGWEYLRFQSLDNFNAAKNTSADLAVVMFLIDAEIDNPSVPDPGYLTNTEFSWLPSAARTTTQTSPDIPTQGFRSIGVVFDQTVSSASPSNTLTINGKDPVSGKYYPLLASTAIATNLTTVINAGSGLATTTNVSANVPLPAVIQLVITAGNANSGTYSVGYHLSV